MDRCSGHLVRSFSSWLHVFCDDAGSAGLRRDTLGILRAEIFSYTTPLKQRNWMTLTKNYGLVLSIKQDRRLGSQLPITLVSMV